MEKKTKNGLKKIVTEIYYSEILKSPSIIRVDYIDEMQSFFGKKYEKTENKSGYKIETKKWNSKISWEVLYENSEKIKIETQRLFYKKFEHKIFLEKFNSLIEKYIESSKKYKI